jgi:hypothetical protein
MPYVAAAEVLLAGVDMAPAYGDAALELPEHAAAVTAANDATETNASDSPRFDRK